MAEITAGGISNIFLTSCPFNQRNEFTNPINIARYQELLRTVSAADKVFVADHVPSLQAQTGILAVRDHLASRLRSLVRCSLPRILANLDQGIVRLQREIADFRDDALPHWIKTHLSEFCSYFVDGIKQFWKGKKGKYLQGFTLEQEVELLREGLKPFSYRTSTLWKRNDTRARLEGPLMFAEFKGSAQLRRALREFQLCLFTSTPSIDDAPTRRELSSRMRNARMAIAQKGNALTSWDQVAPDVMEFLTKHHFEEDIGTLRLVLKSILSSWKEGAISFARKKTDSRVQVPWLVEEQMGIAFVRIWKTSFQDSLTPCRILFSHRSCKQATHLMCLSI